MSSCGTRKTCLLVAPEDTYEHDLCFYIIFLLYLMSCISNAPTILGVSEGMCSINLGGLQADIKGGSGGAAAPPGNMD